MGLQKNILEVRHLSKNFGATKALEDVSFNISSGRVYTVLGENGSGKSTLVKLLSGIIPPQAGEIFINGEKTTDFSPGYFLRKGIAIVLQEVLVSPNLSVLENIFLGNDGLFRRRFSFEEKRKESTRIISKLTDKKIDIHAKISDLPLREQQIVVIARGLFRNPKVLILDEVTAAIDLVDRNYLFQSIMEFRNSGGIVIFVSHRMPEIIEVSDEVFILKNGNLTHKITGNGICSENLMKCLLGN